MEVGEFVLAPEPAPLPGVEIQPESPSVKVPVTEGRIDSPRKEEGRRSKEG